MEVGQLPNFVPEDEKTRYAFYIMTSQGLKFECSSMSEIQVKECTMPPPTPNKTENILVYLVVLDPDNH